MDQIVNGAIISHLQKDGFPVIAEELSELTGVQASKTENEIDIKRSIERLLEEGLPFLCY